jgi:hypothetical protein
LDLKVSLRTTRDFVECLYRPDLLEGTIGKGSGIGKAVVFALVACLTLVSWGCEDSVKGPDKTPTIDVLRGLTSIPDGTGSYSFADTAMGSTADAIFTIKNQGNSVLSLNGSPLVQIGGTDATLFSVIAQPATSIAAGASTDFTVRFAPTATGSKTATVSIASDDPKDNLRVFSISGMATAVPSPEMNVKQSTVDIPDGTGSYSFTSLAVGGSEETSFTIENTGDQSLALGGSPIVSIGGTSADQFSVTVQPASNSLAAGGTATFTVRFAPTNAGTKTAAVSIANDDSDEDPYDFAISGVGAADPPEIEIRQASTIVADGTGAFTFPMTAVTTPATADFTIFNLGDSDLDLTGGASLIQFGGTNASNFTVTVQPSSPIAAGASTTFTIRFAPTSSGLKSATLSIPNNDADENPYNFALSGRAMDTLTPEINIKQGSTSIADGGSFAYSGPTVLGASTDAVFTIENLGVQDLSLSGVPIVQIGGANADQFSVTAQPTTPIPGNGSSSFTLRFTPTSGGTKAATISVASDDPNENPYDIAISGSCASEWSGLKTVDSASTVGSYGTAVGAIGDTLLATYNEDLASGLDGRLKLARSTDGGASWTISNLDTASSSGRFSSMRTAGNSVYVSYSVGSSGLRFARSDDAGATWPVKNSVVSSGNTWYSSLAVDGSDVYISYYNGSSGLTVAKSIDNGATWLSGNRIIVDSSAKTGDYSSIAVSGNKVYVSYYDFTNQDLKFAKSTDGGASWATVSTLDSAGNVGDSSSIGLNGSEVYICYHDTTNDDLKLAKSADEGDAWTLSVINDPSYVGDYNSMAIYGGAIYASYQLTDSNTRLRFAKSTDGGGAWSFTTVDTNSYTGSCTSIAVDGSKVYISEVQTNAKDLKFAKSIDGGTTW